MPPASPAPSDLQGEHEESDTDTMDSTTQATSMPENQYEVNSRIPNGTAESAAAQSKRRWRSFLIRAKTTIYLIGGFAGIIFLGHVPLTCMILDIQYLMVRELYALADKAQSNKEKYQGKRRKAPQWYFFWVAAFWMYFRFVKNQLAVEITANATTARLLGWVIKQHSIIAFALYTAGFVAFVLRLEKGYYLFQFRQYAWIHLILLFVFMPSSFFVSNIFDGIIWFLLPCSLVIINDIGAYLAGICIGRTPLIKLSPKKTWEGFFGGLLMTVGAAWFLADWMSRYQWMICPRTDLSIGWLSCEPEDLYKPAVYAASDLFGFVPPYLAALVHPLISLVPQYIIGFQFVAKPMQLHAISLALFASVIAPFGGFFASGFKRSFKIKDFGDSIPGHGGMTDRMDCQVVMAVFSYLYFNNYIAQVEGMSVGAVMSTVLQLDTKAQLELFNKLGNMLAAQHQLPAQNGTPG